MAEPKFGRLTPKTWKHIEKYPLRRLCLPAPASVEKVLRRPGLRTVYDQKNTNGCTGYSATWMMSIYNRPLRIYNASWLYQQGTLVDGDPMTSPETDAGGYIWAVMEVLRTQGHVIKKRDGTDWPPRKEEGIQSYYWCQTVDDMRTAIALGRPVVLGINWYESFMYPIHKGTGYWIGEQQNFGNWLGGHAICCHGARDSRQAFYLVNSWGVEYPPVWIPYETVNRLLGELGEAAVALDL